MTVNTMSSRFPYMYAAAVYAGSGLVGSASSILVILAGAAAAWQAYCGVFTNKILKRYLRPIWIGVLGYYFAGVISAVLNPTDYESVSQLVERIPFLFIPLLIQAVYQLDARKLLDWSVLGAALGATFGSVYAFLTFQGVHTRIEAFSGNPNIFGYASNVLLILSFAGVLIGSNRIVKTAAAVAVLMAFGLIILSGSRTAMIGGFVTLFVMIWYCWPWRSAFVKAGFFAALIVVAILGIAKTPAGDRLVSAYSELTTEMTSYKSPNGQRIAVWQCGWKIGSQAPIFGKGHDSALEEMYFCLQEDFNLDIPFTHFHNVFLDQFAKAGIVGVIGVLLLFCAPVFLIIRTWFAAKNIESMFLRVTIAGIVSLLSVQIIAGLFNIGLGHDIVDMMFIYTLSLLFGIGLSTDSVAEHPEDAKS